MHSADFGPGFPEAYSLSFDPHNEQLTQDAGGVELDAAAIKKAHPEVQVRAGGRGRIRLEGWRARAR